MKCDFHDALKVWFDAITTIGDCQDVLSDRVSSIVCTTVAYTASNSGTNQLIQESPSTLLDICIQELSAIVERAKCCVIFLMCVDDLVRVF